MSSPFNGLQRAQLSRLVEAEELGYRRGLRRAIELIPEIGEDMGMGDVVYELRQALEAELDHIADANKKVEESNQ